MKNLTKKIVALASVAVLTLAMGLTAFAAGSPVAGVTASDNVTLSAASVTPSLSDSAVADLVSKAGITANASVLAAFDINAAGWTAGQTITLNVPSVTANSKVVVLHYVGNAWTVEPSTCGAGTVSITPSSLSPFAIVADTTTLSTAKTTGTATSPKTGEASTVAVVSLVALLACAVAFTAKKRA